MEAAAAAGAGNGDYSSGGHDTTTHTKRTTTHSGTTMFLPDLDGGIRAAANKAKAAYQKNNAEESRKAHQEKHRQMCQKVAALDSSTTSSGDGVSATTRFTESYQPYSSMVEPDPTTPPPSGSEETALQHQQDNYSDDDSSTATAAGSMAAATTITIGGVNERHQMTSSEYLKALVFGGLDGIVTIFAIVAGCVGAQLGPLKIIIIGLGNLFADGVSMGFGEYVSAKTEEDFIRSEKDRELWEVENCPDEERAEMLDIYILRYGFTLEDAKKMVDIAFKYKRFFIQHMMVEELGLMIGDDGPTPIRRGVVMFLSFCMFGLLPLGGFIGWEAGYGIEHSRKSTEIAFLTACLVSLVTLFVLGFFKGRFVGQNATTSGLLMTLNGAFAGFIAFAIGGMLQAYVGAEGGVVAG